jgi:hypothetical protein
VLPAFWADAEDELLLWGLAAAERTAGPVARDGGREE